MHVTDMLEWLILCVLLKILKGSCSEIYFCDCLQAPVQVASQLSSVTQTTSSKADQEESGGEGKSDSASWKGRPSSGDEAMHGDESTEDFKSFSKQKRTVSRIHMPCGTRTQVSSLEVAQKVL